VGVDRDYGARDSCGDAHGHLVARARSPHAKPYGDDAARAPPAATRPTTCLRRRAGEPTCANRGQFWRGNCRQHGWVFIGRTLLARRASWGVMGHCP
jgi:hypothetical protein